MGMTSRVAAGRILRNESLITISGQAPKKSSVTHTALAVERQLHTVRVWNNIAIIARSAVARIFAELGMSLEIICTAVVAIPELVRVVEQRVLTPVHVEDRRRGGHAKEQGRTGCGVDDPVPGVQRWREEAARLPLEGLFLVSLIAAPDLRRAASLDHVENFLVHVLFRSNGACAGHLDYVHPLEPAAAVKLDERASCAHAFPRCQSQIADVVESHRAAMDREILLIHVNFIRTGLPY